MWNNKRIIVSMTSWKKRIGNVSKVVYSLLQNTIKPDLIICNLSSDEFQMKENELPEELLSLSKLTTFEIFWVKENTNVFKKIIPTLKRFNGENYYLFSVDDDELYDKTYIETGLCALNTEQAVVIAKRNPQSTAVWGGMFCCRSNIFKSDYWENISKELIAEKMDDDYTNKYLRFYKINVKTIAECHTRKYNDIFPNRGKTGSYPPEKIQKVKNIVECIFKEKFITN